MIEPDDVPDIDPNTIEDYTPPPLTAERKSGLSRRRLLKGPDEVVMKTLDVPITYDVQLKNWRLLEDFTIIYQGTTLTAHKGFSYDLASIPRTLWWLIAPNELSIVAPLFHDLLYVYKGKLPDETYVSPYRTYTRRETDQLFLHLMQAEGVARWRRVTAYSAVRASGELFWIT
jgi:hypothetical protein